MKLNSIASAAMALLVGHVLTANTPLAAEPHRFAGDFSYRVYDGKLAPPDSAEEQTPTVEDNAPAADRKLIETPRQGTLVLAARPLAAVASPHQPQSLAAPGPISPRKKLADKRNKLKEIKALATRMSMQYLPRLKPYAKDYPRLVDAVRRYWRQNTANPDARRLTEIIMRHVKLRHHLLARPRILAGTRKGIALLKQELRNM